jgi:hypothetical protein
VTRDPRIDPKPGDVLRKSASTVTIDRISAHGVTYTFDGLPSEMPPMTRWDRPFLPEWRKWAATAEVISRAEDSPKPNEFSK